MIYDNELKKKKTAATYMLYADNRVDLKKEAIKFIKKVYMIHENKEYKDVLSLNNVFYFGDDISLKIADMRKIIKEANMSSYDGKIKVIVIDNIDKIDPKTSNLLLKTIEEPVNKIYFLLLTHTLDILPTIKSRCIIFEVEYKSYDIDSEIYYVFDGNQEDIENYLKLDDATKESIFNISEEEAYNLIENNILFKKIFISKIANKISLYKHDKENLFKYIHFIMDLIKDDENEKEYLLEILNKVILQDKEIGISKYKRLITLKNAVSSNVSIQKTFSLFFINYVEETNENRNI